MSSVPTRGFSPTGRASCTRVHAAGGEPVRVAVFSSSPYVQEFLKPHFEAFSPTFVPGRLDSSSVQFAEGHDVVCNFVNDECGEQVLKSLSEMGVRYVAAVIVSSSSCRTLL